MKYFFVASEDPDLTISSCFVPCLNGCFTFVGPERQALFASVFRTALSSLRTSGSTRRFACPPRLRWAWASSLRIRFSTLLEDEPNLLFEREAASFPSSGWALHFAEAHEDGQLV